MDSSKITLTEGQDSALEMVGRLLAVGGAAFGVVSGWAGTGKTTLIEQVAERHGPPLVVTPTGKAALRVTEATGLDASTIHRWAYETREDPDTGETRWRRKPANKICLPTNGLVVLDEASMLGEAVWRDLWVLCQAAGLRVVLVGDPFQLPPVVRREDGQWGTFSALTDLKTDHRVDLTEVVRQALDSPIIRASVDIRSGAEGARRAMGSLARVASSRESLVREFLALGPSRAMVAHTNQCRQDLNLAVRSALGLGDELAAGEPLLVLLNTYCLDRFNGEVVTFDGWRQHPDDQVGVRDRHKNLSATVSFGIAGVDGSAAMVSPEEVFAQCGSMPSTTLQRAARAYAIERWGTPKEEVVPYLSANLGHCLTCHKAQGSEWDDVVVVVEPSVGGPQGRYGVEGRRWLYTAITRARKSAVVRILDREDSLYHI